MKRILEGPHPDVATNTSVVSGVESLIEQVSELERREYGDPLVVRLVWNGQNHMGVWFTGGLTPRTKDVQFEKTHAHAHTHNNST